MYGGRVDVISFKTVSTCVVAFDKCERTTKIETTCDCKEKSQSQVDREQGGSTNRHRLMAET
eukprot:764883-Hanusia_phi.AAC.2